MLTEISFNALEFICLNLRQCDKDEIFALRDHDNPLQLAMEAHAAIMNQGRGKIAWHKGRPAAVGAFTNEWGGVWYIWQFGTDDYKAVAFELARWMRSEANEILNYCAGHRVHCESKSDHHEAHKLLRAMGAREEGVKEQFGKNGEDFITFVWLRSKDSAVLQPHFKRADNAV